MTDYWDDERGPELTDSEAAETAETLQAWAARMPADTPLLAFLDGSVATALDVAEAMDDHESELRQHFLHMVAVTLSEGRRPLQAILSSYREDLR